MLKRYRFFEIILYTLLLLNAIHFLHISNHLLHLNHGNSDVLLQIEHAHYDEDVIEKAGTFHVVHKSSCPICLNFQKLNAILPSLSMLLLMVVFVANQLFFQEKFLSFKFHYFQQRAPPAFI